MTRQRRGLPVFDEVTTYLGLGVGAPPENNMVNCAIGAAHEAGHCHLADRYGLVWDVSLFECGGGEVEHDVSDSLDRDVQRARIERTLVYLSGPAAEVLCSWGQATLAGTGSASDFRGAWRALATDFPSEPGRLWKLGQLFLQVRADLALHWIEVANVAGHVLRQQPDRRGARHLRAGEVRRILSGEELNMAHVFFNALHGIG